MPETPNSSRWARKVCYLDLVCTTHVSLFCAGSFSLALVTNIIHILSFLFFFLNCLSSSVLYVSSKRQRFLFTLTSATSWHLEYKVQKWVFVLYILVITNHANNPTYYYSHFTCGKLEFRGVKKCIQYHTAGGRARIQSQIIWFPSSCPDFKILSAQVSVSLKCIFILSWAIPKLRFLGRLNAISILWSHSVHTE